MRFAIDVLLVLFAGVGHFSLTVWLYNRLLAVALPRRSVKRTEKVLLLAAAPLGIWVLVQPMFFQAAAARITGSVDPLYVGWHLYAAFCWLVAAAAIPLWLLPKLLQRSPAAILSNDTMMIDVAKRLGRRPVDGSRAKWLAGLPGNEVCQIAVQRKRICLRGLPAALDGLSIAHLTDLHMTGQLTREFYEAIVGETNALRPDLVLITGDILEKEECLPWIPSTLGRLEARYGKFFVLGNHEQRLADPDQLRRALIESGMIDLGGKAIRVSIGDSQVLLAGTELPWFGDAPTIPHDDNSQIRILLSHTPDQIRWAQQQRFDLMLAGHNHGGQVRLPYLGALLSPSKYGSRFAGGLYAEPPTLLHVSRGLGSDHLIRWNCPPELALLTLTTGTDARH